MKLIHVGIIYRQKLGCRYLFLRKVSDIRYTWFEEEEELPVSEEVSAPNIEEALRLAHRHFKNEGFHTLQCGFRYSLPERDEHGMNALFFQMVASQSSPGGVYFDEELGHNCFVQNSSLKALDLWRDLQRQNKL